MFEIVLPVGTLALDLAAECGNSRLSAAMAEDAFKQTQTLSDQVWIGLCGVPVCGRAFVHASVHWHATHASLPLAPTKFTP